MTRPMRMLTTTIAAVLLTTAGFTTLRGQPERPQADDVKALLAEVRALRLTIERAATQGHEAQLLLGRVQLQENRLATLGRQYDDARRKVLEAQQAETELEHRLQLMSGRLRSAVESAEREALDAELPHLKHEIVRQQSRTAQLRADETAAFSALSSEQQRWAAFNDRLETIERGLSQAAVTPP